MECITSLSESTPENPGPALANDEISYGLPYLEKTGGYLLVVSSIGAQSRIPYSSSYCVSKHALNRFVEFVTIGTR